MSFKYLSPITELKRDASAMITHARERGEPIVITQGGRATAVLQDVATYEADRQAFALLKLALQGDAEVAAGRGLSLAEHRRRMATVFATAKAAQATAKPVTAKSAKSAKRAKSAK